MKNILGDIKVIAIVLSCTILYPVLIYGKVNVIDTINLLLLITFSICLSTMIITYYSNRKYLSNLYKSLSISFFGIGISFLTFTNIIKNGFSNSNFWISATAFNTILSIFESLLLIFSIINFNRKINFTIFLQVTIMLSLFISFIGREYIYSIEKSFNSETFEIIRCTARSVALSLKVILLFTIINKRECFVKNVYNNFIIFTILRIILHVFGFAGKTYVDLWIVYLCCCLLAIANYYIVKIMIIEIIRNPQEYLYKDLVDKTVKLEETIKELKKVNNQKEIIKSNLEKKSYEDKVKTELLTNLSHEFKTPVNVIYAAVQTEQLNKDKYDAEEMTKYNSIIKQNCNRLIKTINNFIDVNEFEGGNRQLNLKCYNIVYITECIVDSVVPYAESKNLKIIFDTSDEVLFCILDLELYERAILNLLSNSIKYTNIKEEIKVTIEKVNNNIEICVVDHGIGISEEYLNVIFKRFERVDKTFSRDTEGAGLGLNIAKDIVELHKGKIKVVSKKKRGTKVTVTLPAYFGEDAEECEDDDINIFESMKEKAAIEMSDIYFS